MRLTLDTPVSEISQVGKTIAQRLHQLGISTAEDLIFYYPFRYEDFSQISSIGKIGAEDTVTVKGTIELISNRRGWRKRLLLTEALVADASGSIKVIWFNQPYLTKLLQPGDEIYLSGRVDTQHTLQLVNPIYEKVKRGSDTIHTARLVPIYSVVSGLTQKQIRWLISLGLKAVNQLNDWLPVGIQRPLALYSLDTALCQIHFPDSKKSLTAAIRRLKFNELFLFLLQTQTLKKELEQAAAPQIDFFEKETKEFVASLPFTLTADQKKAAWQIIKDLGRAHPMNRLLEGDVGSGKTMVIALAGFNAALAGYQTVIMAPTEILALQHYQTLQRLFAGKKIQFGLLTRTHRRLGAKISTKAKLLTALSNGNLDIVVGTHALLQTEIKFFQLGLVVIDEQHRFGVQQRRILHQKGFAAGQTPHFLSTTATPIPRSLALTLYGDLDLSIMRQMPHDRKKIITRVITPDQRQESYDFIASEVAAGRQVFVICPLIDPSDKLGVRSVTQEYEKLNQDIFPNLRIAMLHGKLKSAEKEKIMADFVAQQSDILVATSVIEVGIDIPNATVMMIEGAERFGLAQLHQFRGRVGRGKHQSYCFLLSDRDQKNVRARLAAVAQARDGFELAEKDLALRGPGELLGVDQSGWPEFRIANLFDYELIRLAKIEAEKLLAEDPTLARHQALREKIEQLNQKVHLE